ncbi:MAG: formate/nitrite transporter family protein [Ktedonobacterales bacterium]
MSISHPSERDAAEADQARSDHTDRSVVPLPKLSAADRKEVEHRASLSTIMVHEIIREEGERELERPAAAVAWSGLAAGLSMGFSMIGMGLLRAYLPAAPWRPAVASLGYSLGFLIVILGRQQLFTENTLTPILPLLTHPDWRTLWRVGRLWSIVLLANVLGAFIFATIVAHTDLFDTHIQHAFMGLALDSLRGGFGLTLLRAVFAGWLIALMIWLLPAAETAKVHIIIILTYLVALGGFAHIIAGSVEVLYLVSTGAATWQTFLGGFFLPTLLGNIIGGVSLVAALSFAQVAAEVNQSS